MSARSFFRSASWLAWLAVAAVPRSAWAQSYWEFAPYRIQALVSVAEAPEFGEAAHEDLLAGLTKRVESVIGAPWEFEARAAPSRLRYTIGRRIDSLTVADVPVAEVTADWYDLDKVVVMGIVAGPGRFQVSAREFDCRTRVWSAAVTRGTRQSAGLGREMFLALLDAHAPLGRIEATGDRVTIHLKASRLPARDASYNPVHAGDIFLPVIRHNDRDGNPRPGGIEAIPWTLMVVEEAAGDGIRCAVHSGFRQPFAGRRRARVEQLALAMKNEHRPGTADRPAASRLQLRSRSEPQRPLAGYEIFRRQLSGKTTRLGMTDSRGEVTVPPGSEPLELLVVKHGSQLLARLPITRGMPPQMTASIPDDDLRLQAEAFLVSLTAELVDVAARREILISRAYRQLETSELKAAKKLIDELRRLPTREQLRLRINQQARQSVSPDLRTQARIDLMFASARKLLDNYLDRKPIDQLQTEYNRARK